MSTLKVSTLQNLSGTEVYTCKAWVNFNGTGTVAIRASGNVSSITDNGTGDYTVNFTTALADANYASLITCGDDNTLNSGLRVGNAIANTARTTTALRISCTTISSGTNRTPVDDATMSVSIFR